MIEDRIVRPKEVTRITGLSLTTIWREEQKGDFPMKVQLGAKAIGYKLSEILAWLESRKAVNNHIVMPKSPGRYGGKAA